MALDPINYIGMIQQAQGGGLGDAITSGLQTGAAIQQFRAQRQQADQAAQYAADVQAAFNSGSARDFAALSAKYPQQREAFKQSWDMLNKDQQDQEFGTGVQVWNALGSGRADVAKSLLDQHIAALKNAGDDTSDLENIKRSIDADPRQARNMIGLSLSAIDPDRWGKIATEQRSAESAPFELSEKAAKAQKAAVDAKFAESKAVQDLSKGGWEIQKLANDINISKLNSQIAAMNAQTSREGNDMKRQELQLKLDDKIQKRDDAVRAKAAGVAQSRSTIDNSLSTIDRVLKNPALNAVLGSVEGSDFYPATLVGLLPGTASSDDRADALADIDTLMSQTFLTQLQALKDSSASGGTGLGALTEKEGDRLINGVQSFRRKQSEKQYKENLQEVQRLLLKARGNIADRYGVPDTIPDRPNLESQPASSGFRVLGVE